MANYAQEMWLSEQEGETQEFAEYWNSEDHDRKKPWYVIDGGFQDMESYLRSKHLPQDIQTCIAALRSEFGVELQGVGLDVAAGNLWAVPQLLQQPKVDKVYCVEFSKHRLFKIGPRVLEHYGVRPEQAVLAYGSFYDLKLDDQSVDFVFMSQALHHASDADALMREVSRVLRPGGVVIVIGEKLILPLRTYGRHCAKWLVSKTIPKSLQRKIFGKALHLRVDKIFPALSELHPPHAVMGDHHYTMKQYQQLFDKFGLQYHVASTRNACAAFVLHRPVQ